MKNLRAGSKVTVDGEPGVVGREHGGKVFVSWFVGEPVTLPDGRRLGWSTANTRDEWIAIDSDRLTDR